jgi:transposase
MSLTKAQRGQIIELALEGKKTERGIARLMGIPKTTVHDVLHQFKTEHTLDRHSGSGRPRAMDPALLKALDKILKKKPTATSQELTAALLARTGRRVNERTVRRARRGLDYRPVHASRKPALNPQQAEKRLSFCRKHTRDGLKHMVFMDEMGIDLDQQKRIFWIKPGQPRPVEYRHPRIARLNVWGAIWGTGRTALYCTNETFNGEHYLRVLRSHLHPHLPLPRREFIQDGVPFHWTRAVQDWCATARVNLVQDFPPASPDLNAIEYLWGWMKHKVAAAEPHDQRSLESAVRAAWANVSQNTIRSYINHMPTVVRSIVANNGWNSD